MKNTYCRPQKFVVSLLFGERGPLNWWNFVLELWNSNALAKKAAAFISSTAFWPAWAFRGLHFNVYRNFSWLRLMTGLKELLNTNVKGLKPRPWQEQDKKISRWLLASQRASRTFIMMRRSVHQVEGHISWTWPPKDKVCELLIGPWRTAFISIVNTFSAEQLSDMFNSVPSLDKVSPTYYSKMSQESQILLEINAETFKLIKRTI